MKIVHLCLGNFFIDGYSYQENMLPKYHVMQGHEVTMIASLFIFGSDGKGKFLSSPSTYWDANGFKVIRLAYKHPVRWGRFFRHYQSFEKVLQEESPDIVFSHNVSYGDVGVVANYMKQHPNVKLYADNHADYINSARNVLSKCILHSIIWRHYAKKLESYMSKCYGVTPMRCRFLKEMYHINPDLIEYLPLGVDDESIPADRKKVRDKVRDELNIPENAFIVITGGKIDKLKNTHILFEALGNLKDERIHLVICGVLTPEMAYLQEWMNANRNIHYLGWCDAERVMDCMVASDLACFPGTHSTLWEQSIGVGLPAVFKHWPEMEHVNVNGNSILLETEDVKELENALKVIINGGYDQMKENAIKASRNFLYSEIAKKAIQCPNSIS